MKKSRVITGVLAAAVFCAASIAIAAGTGETQDIEPLLKAAARYETADKFQDAIKEYAKAVEADPLDARAYFGAGTIYLKLRNYVLAEEKLKKAIELDSTKGVYFSNLAWLYIEEGRYVEAKNTAMRGLSIEMDRRYILLDASAMADIAVGNYSMAEIDLKNAAMMVPPADIDAQFRIYTHFYELYTRQGKIKEAAAALKAVDDLKRGMPVAVPPFR